MNLEENEYKDNFTKEGDKTNLNINKLEVDCITSNKNNFILDEEGNLKVKSISLNNTNTEIDLIYPIGSIYMNVSNVNPTTLFGGTWERIEDRFLLASGNNYSNGTTGGSNQASVQMELFHTGGIAYMDYRQQNFTTNYKSNIRIYSNGGAQHSLEENQNYGVAVTNTNNTSELMPPYLAVNIWKRIG